MPPPTPIMPLNNPIEAPIGTDVCIEGGAESSEWVSLCCVVANRKAANKRAAERSES